MTDHTDRLSDEQIVEAIEWQGPGFLKWVKPLAREVQERRVADTRTPSDGLDYRWWADLLAGNNCYCASDAIDPGVCTPCAYRQTVRQADEAVLGESPVPCVCGEPTTQGTVHRTDGPCYVSPVPCPECNDDPRFYMDQFGYEHPEPAPCPTCRGEQ